MRTSLDGIKPLPKDDFGKAQNYFELANDLLRVMKPNAKKIEVKYIDEEYEAEFQMEQARGN
jgi:hypothetical protein